MTAHDPRIRIDASLSFEVDPKSSVFDRVRAFVTDAVVDRYDDVLRIDDARASIRTDDVTLEGGAWRVDVSLYSDGVEAGLDLRVPTGDGPVDDVYAYLDREVEARFGVDSGRVSYLRVRLAPGAWFVDGRIEGEWA